METFVESFLNSKSLCVTKQQESLRFPQIQQHGGSRDCRILAGQQWGSHGFGGRALQLRKAIGAVPEWGRTPRCSTPMLHSGASLHLLKLPEMFLKMHIPGSPRPT